MNVKTLGLAAFLMATAGAPAMADSMNVVQNGAEVVRLDGQITSVIVGNPTIADAIVLDGGILVVQGRSFGTTTLTVLDGAGGTLLNTMVNVGAPTTEQVALFRGVGQHTYVCPDNCVAVHQAGDDLENSNAIFNQNREYEELTDWGVEQSEGGNR